MTSSHQHHRAGRRKKSVLRYVETINSSEDHPNASETGRGEISSLCSSGQALWRKKKLALEQLLRRTIKGIRHWWSPKRRWRMFVLVRFNKERLRQDLIAFCRCLGKDRNRPQVEQTNLKYRMMLAQEYVGANWNSLQLDIRRSVPISTAMLRIGSLSGGWRWSKSFYGMDNVTVGIRLEQTSEVPMVLSQCREPIIADANSGFLRGYRCCYLD